MSTKRQRLAMVRDMNITRSCLQFLNSLSISSRLNHSEPSLSSQPNHTINFEDLQTPNFVTSVQDISNCNPKLAISGCDKNVKEEAREPFDEMPQRSTPSLSSQSQQRFNPKQHQTPNVVSDPHTYDCNMRIKSMGSQKRVKEARKLFDEMPHRDVFSYVSMISVYLKNGDLSNAEKLFQIIPGNSVVASSVMIDGYAKANRIEEARWVFDSMPERNVFSWTSLISGYLRIGDVDEAKRLFDLMPEKNIVSWTTMVLGCARNGMIDDACRYFSQMPEKNVVAWTVMIKSLVENNKIGEARILFDEMPLRNLYSWNIMLSGYCDANRVIEAIQLFKLMPRRNVVSWTTMVTGLARNRLTKHAREYFDQMPQRDIAAWNAIITAYVDDGLMNEASSLFNLMGEKNTVTWNAIIDGYSRNGPQHEALKQLISMRHAGDNPNETTITSVVSACESRVELMQVHSLVVLFGFESEASLTNALITTYSRCGDIPSAHNAFKNLKSKDIVSWTAMMLAYSNHGCGHHALQTFSSMLKSGVKPDHISFVAVLSACSHAGLPEKGQRLFNSMSQAYGLEPKAEHYSCLVDVLGRSGRLNEALEVVTQMPPIKRDGAVLGALLGACKSHGDIDVANQIAEEMIKLEPTCSGGYMLLANIYAQHGRWDDFASVRKRMKNMKVTKVPGCSQIEVDREWHLFFSGDRSHPQGKEIRDLLQEKLVLQMKEIIYLQGSSTDFFYLEEF